MGTPDFAVESLDKLYNAGYNIKAVVTAPDKPAGRGKKMKQPEIKKYALQKGLEVLQPVKLKNEEFVNKLKELNLHLGVVVAFRMLPEVVWALPKYGTINLHASLLPQYRGAAPINHVLINGETETGITTFFLDKEIDTGKIILQTVDLIREGKAEEIPQEKLFNDTGELKTAPKIFKDDCRINWNMPLHKVYNHIRGLSPFPAPFSYLIVDGGKKVLIKIYKALPEKSNHNLKSGTIVTDNKNYLKIALPGGFINVSELQGEGRKRMPVADFLRGFKISDNWYFEVLPEKIAP